MTDATLSWLGTSLCITGIALTSFNIFPLNIFLGFTGSYLWAVVGYRKADFALFTVEAVAVVFYMAGLFSYFLGVL